MNLVRPIIHRNYSFRKIIAHNEQFLKVTTINVPREQFCQSPIEIQRRGFSCLEMKPKVYITRSSVPQIGIDLLKEE